MATFRAVILHGQRHTKEDGTTNVKIRITHRRTIQYISTDLYVIPGTFQKGLVTGEDSTWINSRITDKLATFQTRYLKLGNLSEKLTSSELKVELMRKDDRQEIDFLKFSDNYLQQLKDRGKIGSWRGTRGVVAQLHKYADRINFSDVDTRFLSDFERFLRRGGVTDAIPTYMVRLRLIFNRGRAEYNDEDRGIIRIPNYPFRRYRITQRIAPASGNSLTRDQYRILTGYVTKTARERLGIDVFRVMICMMGINSKDLYLLSKVRSGRIEYSRAKTGKKYSCLIVKELHDLIQKYSGMQRIFNFADSYRTADNFHKAVNIGLASVCTNLHTAAKTKNETLDFPAKITSNWARHTWATIARNDCGVSKSDVAMCLGHGENTVTDYYIKPDYTLIDGINRKVLDYLFA